jgi:hypothetical protein
MPIRHREIILMAIFIALAIAGGLFLAQLPNIELVTVTIFLSGMALGVMRGAVVGAVAEFLYSLFNPYGVAAPPLLAAQAISMALAGVAGGVIRNFLSAPRPPVWLLGLAGFSLTFVFDLLTTLSFTVLVGSGLAGFFAAVAFGLYFYIAHQVSNTLIFVLLLPVLWRRLRPLFGSRTILPAVQTLQQPELQPSLPFSAERNSSL